jgi:PKD repeat protein
MKKNLPIFRLFALLLLVTLSLSSRAQLLFEENFSYTVGDLLTSHGWTAHSGAGTNAVATTATSIAYPGYLSSGIGNEIALLANGEDDNKTFTPQTTGTVYTSFLAHFTLATTTGDYFAHLGQNTIGTLFKARVFVKNDGAGNLAFGITHTGGGANTPVYTGFTYALNTTYLIVIKYTFVAGANNDIVSLIINPVIGAAEPPATVTAADAAQTDPTDIGSVAVRQGTASSGPNLKLDGIRVGQSWNDVAAAAVAVSLTVGSPVTGDQWRQGSTHNITWTASATNANVKIEYSDNASAGSPTWTTLNPSVAASAGTWAWSIPAGQALSSDCKIRVTDIPQTAQGVSGTFSIVPPPTPVSTLAALRAGVAGTVYTYTGQGILTFKQNFRKQKFIQDATAAILIDDNAGKITTNYNVGDAITNLTGTVAEFGGMIQLTPESDPGPAASTGNTIEPEVITMSALTANFENYESELVKFRFSQFANAGTAFANGTVYPMTDFYGGSTNFRTTFYDVDYIGTNIPSGYVDIVGIPNSRAEGPFFTSRSLADITPSPMTSNDLTISEIYYNPPDGGNDTIEFVELYNRGTNGINVKDWYFTDGIQYTFPDTTIAAGKYFVIARDAMSFKATFGFNAAQWTGDFLADNGEILKFKDMNGFVKDSVYYKPTAPWPTDAAGNGPSIEICNTSLDNSLGENWSASLRFAGFNGVGDSLFATPNGSCSSGANLAITEIMYNPPESGNDSLEFIEIYNNGADINLQGFTVSDAFVLTFPSYTLTSGNYMLVALNSAAIQNTFGKSSLQWTSGALSNSGETITLHDIYGNIVDQVTYGTAAPWPAAANGHGPSLTLCDPASNNAVPEFWKASTEFVVKNAAGDSIFATPLGGCVNPPTVAEFTADPTFIYEGGHIQFTDLSTNTPIAWEWTFPGGTPASATEQNPLIQYTAFGVYSVTLKATNAYGNNTLTKTDYISVGVDGITNLPSKLAVYPNPTTGKVFVTNPSQTLKKITVYTALGSPVAEITSSGDVISLNISSQPAGLYLIRITDTATQTVETTRLVLK